MVERFWDCVEYATGEFVGANLSLPGCFRGTGYTYNEVWRQLSTPSTWSPTKIGFAPVFIFNSIFRCS
jgi:hypothetical protein